MRGFVSYDEFFTIVTEWGQRGTRKTFEETMNVDQYKSVAKMAVDESNESDVTKQALVELTELFQSREGFDKRLMLELGKITKGSGRATTTQIRQAIANLGHELIQGNVDRCVRFYLNKLGNRNISDSVDIIKFINCMTVAYFKLT